MGCCENTLKGVHNPQYISLQPKSVLFLILMHYYAMVATNCQYNLCMHKQAVDSEALTPET